MGPAIRAPDHGYVSYAFSIKYVPMSRVRVALSRDHTCGAVVTSAGRMGTGHPHIQRRQATWKGRRSKNICTTESWM